MDQKLSSTKTIEEAFEYFHYANKFSKLRPNSILTIYIEKLSKPLSKKLKFHNKRVSDLQITQASLDENKDIRRTGEKGSLCTTPQKELEFSAQMEKWSEESFTFEPNYSKLIPPNLTVAEVMAFSGFIIDPEKASYLLEKMEESSEEMIQEKKKQEATVATQQSITEDNLRELTQTEDNK